MGSGLRVLMAALVLGLSGPAVAFSDDDPAQPGTDPTQDPQPPGDDPVLSLTGIGGELPLTPTGDIQARYNTYQLDVLDDTLAGDTIDLDTGALSFLQIDVSIPGNSALPVEFGRRKSRANFAGTWLGNWTPAIPYISRHYLLEFPPSANRCSSELYPAPITVSLTSPYTIEGATYYSGHTLSVPGRNPGALTQVLSGGPSPEFAAIGGRMMTKNNWTVSCLSSIPAGGEGFVATAPNGDQYTFAHRETYYDRDLDIAPDAGYQVWEEVLYVTEIRDVHGNWVRYDYDASGLSRIHANDGREITFTRSGGRITRATANGRHWDYTYDASNQLTRVDLPDGRYWTFTPYMRALDGRLDGICAFHNSTTVPQVVVRHPNGAVIRYDFTVIINGRTWMDYAQRETGEAQPQITDCFVGDVSSKTASGFYSFAVTDKEITLPGGEVYAWTRTYEQDSGSYSNNPGTLSDTKSRTVTDPEGHRTVFHFNRRFGPLEGSLMRREVIPAGQSSPVEVVEYSYQTGNNVGIELRGRDLAGMTNFASSTRIYEITRTVTRGSDVYTTSSAYQTNPAASDFAYNQPHTITRSSTVQSGSRVTTVSHRHDKADWILAQPEIVTQNGRQTDRYYYDALGQVTRHDAMGALNLTFGYHSSGSQAGRVAWMQDALNRRTSFSNYHRGEARLITRPGGSSLSMTVDNNGWVTGLTDWRGTSFSYSHDAAGRLTLINRPAGFDDTTISYSSLGAGMVMTRTRGALREIISHDGFNRPVLVERRALSGGGGSIFTRLDYDGLGRTVFESFPSTTSNPATGVETTYDALGRVTRTRENVSPFATTTTAYLTSNRVRVTDPSGHVTTTWNSGWGGPDDGEPVRIDHPLGLTTQMSYDAWGNLLTARQSGSHSGFAVDETQSWAYDSRLRLCRHVTPETGATLYTYDAANQLVSEARGMSPSAGCGSAPGSARTVYSYDSLGRMTSVNYPDASPDVVMTYDANGNLLTANRGVSAWTYVYDVMNQLVSETLVVDGRSYGTSYGYASDGRLSTQTTPAGRAISLAPDGHGRPTRASVGAVNYASGAAYHPSGQLSALSYGNGLSYSASFNSRQQRIDLIVSRTGLNALDFSYNYDANGRVTTITDHAVSGQNRSFSYDGLGRLATASGPWGAGSYTYDLLNNVRAKQLGAHRVEIEYNADNQVSRARDTRDGNIWRLYGHDARGNVIDNSRLQFTYDRSDQPTAISGTATGSFAYDAHNRRVKQVINGETIYTVYSLSGQILYRDNVTAGEATDYIRMGGRTIARLKNGVATYPHSDHLGSAAAATNASGNLLWREDYTPFGEPRQAPSGNRDDEGFTGHIHDSATGLTYMQARYYDPVIGRFLSNDPVGFATGGPAYFNRYAYTLNNPINLVDPTGMCSTGSRIKREGGGSFGGCSTVGGARSGGDTGGGGNVQDRPASVDRGSRVVPFPSGGSQSIAAGVDERRERRRMDDALGVAAALEAEGQEIVHHYTSLSALSQIASSGSIVSGRNRVYLTPEALGPRDAQISVFIGADSGLPLPLVRGNAVVIIALDPGHPRSPDPNGASFGRIYTPSPLRNGRGARFIYAGPNFYGASYAGQ